MYSVVPEIILDVADEYQIAYYWPLNLTAVFLTLSNGIVPMTASRDTLSLRTRVRGHLRPVGLENHQKDHLGNIPTSQDAPEEQVG